MINAYDELQAFLEDGGTVESLVFGAWGWGYGPADGGEWEPDSSEPMPIAIPLRMRGKLLALSQAEPLMRSWQFSGGYGGPDCYATYIWTDRRIIWVTQYDGSTGLDSAPRNPIECIPDMPGG